MTRTVSHAVAALAVLAGTAAAALAGGFFLTFERPTPAKGDARLTDAVLVVRAGGCIRPGDAALSARAEGIVNGERRSVAVAPVAVTPGVWAIRRQWPAEGVWVLTVEGKAHRMFLNALVEFGPDGRLRAAPVAGKTRELAVKRFAQKPTEAEIAAALRSLAAAGAGAVPAATRSAAAH